MFHLKHWIALFGVTFGLLCYITGLSLPYSCQDLNTQACELLNDSVTDFCSDTKYSTETCKRFCGNCPLTCFHCDTPVTTGNCTNIQTCSSGETCLLKELTAFDGHLEYIMMCESNQVCEGFGLGFGALGKREAGRQSRDLEFSCCDADLCNRAPGFGCYKDIAFVLDESGSVGSKNFHHLLDFASDVISKLEIGSLDNQVAMETFAYRPEGQWVLNRYSNKSSLLAAVQKVPYHAGSTNTGSALEYTLSKIFTAKGGDRPGVPNAVIVVTDGRSSNRFTTIKAAQHLHAESVDVIAIGISSGIDRREITTIASSSDHAIYLPNFYQLSNVVRNVTKLLCSA